MRSIEQTIVIAVAERLAKAPIGELVSHDALRLVVGAEHADRHWQFVTRAIDLLNKEGGVVFANIRGEGYRRLPAGDGVQYLGDIGFRRMRGQARRTIRRLGNALHYANDLSPEAAKLANQRLATAGLIDHLTKAQTVKNMPEAKPLQPDPLSGLRQALGI